METKYKKRKVEYNPLSKDSGIEQMISSSNYFFVEPEMIEQMIKVNEEAKKYRK